MCAGVFAIEDNVDFRELFGDEFGQHYNAIAEHFRAIAASVLNVETEELPETGGTVSDHGQRGLSKDRLTTMTRNFKAMAGTAPTQEDVDMLTAIKGIGEKTAKALCKAGLTLDILTDMAETKGKAAALKAAAPYCKGRAGSALANELPQTA